MSVPLVRFGAGGFMTHYKCDGTGCGVMSCDPLGPEWTTHWGRHPQGGGLIEIHLCSDACRLEHFPQAKTA